MVFMGDQSLPTGYKMKGDYRKLSASLLPPREGGES